MKEVKGISRVCGLIGNPVEHTLSPTIHNYLAERLGIELVYVPFHVETGYLDQSVKGAFGLNLLGLNVTVPYKTDVLQSLTDIDDLAKRIGAVNTLVRVQDGYKGYNTDMPGLYRAMENDGVNLKGETILILGAGGVARAVAMMAADKAKEIIILNRTIEKAEKIAEEINGYMGRKVVIPQLLEDYKKLQEDKKYLAIQATNVGMHPNVEDVIIDDPDFYKRIHTGYDLIFNPFETRFMKEVAKKGGLAFNGLKMLLFQGIIAFELWTGTKVSDELARDPYQILLKETGNLGKE